MLKYPPINQSNVFVLNCSHCSFHTLLLSSLQEHIRDVHPNLDNYYSLYQCEHCGIISTSSNLLIEHTSLMHGDKQASVNCIYQGSTESANASAFSCMFCEHSSLTPSDLVHHYQNHHGVKNVSSHFLKSKSNSHQKSVKSTNDRKSGSFTQITTDANGSIVPTNPGDTNLNLNGSREIENGEGHWKCKNCGKEYDKKKYFVEHSIACGKSIKLVCLCGRTCKWRSNFYAHRKRCPVYNSQLPKQVDISPKRNIIPAPPNQTTTPTATTVSSGMVFSPSGQLIGIRTGGPLTAQAQQTATLFPIGTSLVQTQIDPSQLQGATVIKAENPDGTPVQTAHLYYTQLSAPAITEVTTSAASM